MCVCACIHRSNVCLSEFVCTNQLGAMLSIFHLKLWNTSATKSFISCKRKPYPRRLNSMLLYLTYFISYSHCRYET